MTLVWLRGHTGIEQNEKVDKLAKKASAIGSRLQDFKVPYSDLFCRIREKVWQDRQNEYQTSVTAKWYRAIQPSVARKPWYAKQCSRVLIRAICRMRTGHALYQEYRYRLSLSNTPFCICGGVGDLHHMFLECTHNNSASFIEKIISLGVQQPFNLPHLLSVNNIDIYGTLFSFQKENNIML